MPGRPSLWYQEAILYELQVRAFRDGNGDGIGDFSGLTERMDYLQGLGVTALWLLPFYPSPLRDGGYDISDYLGVHPAYGTPADFQRFLDEAHRRGLKVITELVLNHTSDQHPWFQRAREAGPGTPERGFYVWSDTPDKYPGSRVIFKDFEPSNWTWDPVAKQYFWHRFYRHQPDLNYDNPAVRRAILEVVDFWLEKGVDGLRLDAVPYLFEREGTSCENLPESHAFLRELRAHVDARFRDRMLLAEANQWAGDAAAYFGRGDECHMAFHFPLMPRLFMAVSREDRSCLVDVLRDTPPIPESCQWALFLRNHDELTLEMVTEEEREELWRAYARDPRARLNLGIRRRLSPLLDNDRGKIELMNALLFFLPGSPVIYCGDEIGMGDDLSLPDRDGVRLPMPWTSGKVSVQDQERDAGSLLQWMRRMIALRRRHPVFGRGSLELLLPDNRSVLGFLRRDAEETILVAANLSGSAQQARMDLRPFQGRALTELVSGKPFPRVGESPYSLTLDPHGFCVLALECLTKRSAG